MILSDFEGAELAVLRLLAHQDSADLSRHDQVQFTCMRLVSQLAQGNLDGPARELAALISNGPYSPGRMALDVYSVLVMFFARVSESAPLTHGMRELAVAIAKAKRSGKRRISACINARTMKEISTVLEDVFYPQYSAGS